jgi:type I restriction-modification system DNA methylase subunit
MKLPEHVDHLRTIITAAFDKQFARLGFGAARPMDLNKLPAELHPERLRFEEMLNNHKDETGSYSQAREKLVDELTFTLFNRIAAVKVMESANLIPPVITRLPEHGDRSFGHKAWLEAHPEMRSEEREGLREYIQHAFNELGDTLPLYSRSYPYGLLPDTISLNEIIDAFNAVEKDPQVGADIWHSDDVLGWLYESYNNAKKEAFKSSGEKVEYDKVYLQSQVYTPRWVVQFLVDNSLGKLYLEMYPDSKIRQAFKIANAPVKPEREPKPLHQVRLIDPACGSGNFLLYAFDQFYALYLDQIENYDADYQKSDIPRLILANNLHGIDLDSRAVQLAQLGLYIKARKKQRKPGSLTFNVVSSDFYLPEFEAARHIFEDGGSLDANQKALIADIWGDLQYAHKFGSLIRLDEKLKEHLRDFVSKRQIQTGLFSDQQLGIKPEPTQPELFWEHDIAQEQEFIRRFFDSLKDAVAQYARAQGSSFLTSQAQDAVTFLELLNKHYDVATANPPYTDSSDFGPELKVFIEENYKKPNAFHANLYSVFIKRCYEFVSQNGYIAMVHPLTFMYIKTFEDVRKFIIEKTHIDLFVEWGYLGMFNPSARVDSAVYILKKAQKDNEDSVFIKLNNLYETKRYDALFEAFDQYLAGGTHELLYTIPQSKLKIIQSWPFIYWISDEFREKFGRNSLENYFKVSQGMSVSNGERFLRFNWELLHNDVFIDNNSMSRKWARFPKGGPYKKWTGNLWLCVNWKDDGKELKSYSKAVLRNQKYYFVEGITYSSSGSKGTTFRILPDSAVISGGGPGIHKTSDQYSNNYCLGYLNSKFVAYIINCLNPTVNTTQGDLNRIPLLDIGKDSIKVVENFVNKCINLSTFLSKFSIVEDNFSGSPIKTRNGNIKESIQDFLSFENHINTFIMLLQSNIDEEILSNVLLPEVDKEMILNKEGRSVGCLPVDAEAQRAYIVNELEDFPLDQIRDFIEALPVKTFSAEERGLIASEFPSLYQANNEFEEFCIHHQVNPINVWYWFKLANILPEQRMHSLAMEFLADLIREILMEDEDGIVPLANGSGEKALLERIEDKFYEKGFSQAQFSTFDSVLGRPLEDYINQHFFAALSDHLNLFMYLPKTPFIWHLSSGPEQGFDCYIIIYKWSRDKLLRIRSQYIERRERALLNRQSDLAGNPSAEAQNKKDKIFKQLKEIEVFKKKIDELLSEGYDPILDDGVGKNIAPLQKKGMLPYAVLNPGQLEKYLHADW